MFLLIYWIISGFIVFSLTQPTVYATTFELSLIGELLICLLIGGLLVPFLLLAFIGYLIKILIFPEDE